MAALAAIAAAQVVLVAALARELGASRRAAVIACLVFAASPLVLQLSITALPYGTSLVLELGAAVAALRASRTLRTAPALVAGALGGLAVFARPYDAIVFGVALVGAVAIRYRDRVPGLVRLAPWVLLGAVVPVAAFLAFNSAMTGDALRLPFGLLEPRDGPGFGLRRALPTDPFVDYTPARAFSALGRNMLLVAAWTGGSAVTCVLAIGALIRRRLPSGIVLAALLVVWPLGYAFFWGSYLAAFIWDGALFLGPYYYLPMVAALAIAGGVGLVDLWEWRPLVGAAAAIGMVVLTFAVAVPALAEQRDRTSQRVAVADAVEAGVEEPALVFVPPLYGNYLQNPFSFLRNRAELGGDVVYALDRGAEADARVRKLYPDRAAYQLLLPGGWSDQPDFEPQVDVHPLDGS